MRRKFVCAIAILLLASMGATMLAAGGTASDPLVTVSYAQKVYTDVVKAKADAKAAELLNTYNSKADAEMTALLGEAQEALDASDVLQQAVMARVSEKLKGNPSLLEGTGMRTLTLQKGERITGETGSTILIVSGSGMIIGPNGSQVIDLTAGKAVVPGTLIGSGSLYMVSTANGSGLSITSATATVKLWDGAAQDNQYTAQYTRYAEALKPLGLFMGTNNGFELERPATRQEALILLIRLLGEEQQALSYQGTSKLTDLPGWADGKKYINYGLNRGYTNGVSPTTFAPQADADANTYLTYVLRALGYDDSKGDFAWNSPGGLAVQVGLLTQTQLQEMQQTGAMRDHVALISLNALNARLKGSAQTLGQRLVEKGVITQTQLNAALSVR